MFSSPKYSKSTGFIPPPPPDGIIGEYIPLHKQPLTALPTRKLPSLSDKTIVLNGKQLQTIFTRIKGDYKRKGLKRNN